MGSNISRDHIAMEAMKVLLERTVTEHISFSNRVKKFFGLDFESYISFDEESLADMSYRIADTMIAQREKILEDKL